MRALALATLLSIPLLAGCVHHGGPTLATQAHLVDVGGAVNQNITWETGRQANELSIAVDPTDPRNVLATGKDYTQPYAGQCVWDGIYVSHDGGATWANSNLPGSPWKLQADALAGNPSPPDAEFSKFYCATDPVVAFGPDGTAYWAVMPYQCDAASGSALGRDVLPAGGLNDWFWTCSSMYVLASADAGDTWPTVSRVAVGPRLQHDKMWLAASPQGKVLLCWDQDAYVSSAGPMTWDALTQGTQGPYPVPSAAGGDLPVPSATVCATSDDKARTWSPVTVASRDVALPWVAFGGDGTAYMAAIDAHQVLVLHSADGLAWSDPVAVGNYTDPSNRLMNGFPSLNGSQFRTFATPSLAVDRSGGAFDGSLYVTWMDAATGTGRILFSRSRDAGATWTPPTWIHDMAAQDANARGDQFMPSVGAGPDGTVDLAWLDRRMDPANHLFDAFYSYSLDGGASFAQPLRISTVSSDEQYSHHQNGAIFLGDYLQTASTAGQAHPIWIDTRNHKADAFTATIARPGANT